MPAGGTSGGAGAVLDAGAVLGVGAVLGAGAGFGVGAVFGDGSVLSAGGSCGPWASTGGITPYSARRQPLSWISQRAEPLSHGLPYG